MGCEKKWRNRGGVSDLLELWSLSGCSGFGSCLTRSEPTDVRLVWFYLIEMSIMVMKVILMALLVWFSGSGISYKKKGGF